MEQDVALGFSSTRLLAGSGSRHSFVERVAKTGGKFVVISDSNVSQAWKSELFPQAHWLTIPAGENSKNIHSAIKLWSQMIALGLDRESIVVAVGGGVVGDLAGFVASTFLRGIRFFSLPTSLLSMVDAAVGGKVGIDIAEGKNLVGQFYPAEMVAVDPQFLSTLPAGDWSSGMAEVIKHGVLAGGALWERLLSWEPSQREVCDTVESVILDALRVKVRVVQDDPYEKTGLRATLNLGHTFGHAIEWCSDFAYSHGAAVGLGMLAGLRLSRELGLLKEDFEEQLLVLLKRWELPTQLDPRANCHQWERMCLAMNCDKKNADGQWGFVLPLSVGEVTTLLGPPKQAVKNAYASLFPERSRPL